MLVSLILLVVCLLIIFDSSFPADYTKWAFGMIGIVVGYWLK